MKELVLDILNQYLKVFPDEKEKQSSVIEYLKKYQYNELVDWNNFDGHIVASGFIYAKKEEKFLILWHKDIKKFLYPGGHVTIEDENILEAAKREVYEETGLTTFEECKITENELVPIDIDTHVVAYNERLNLPQHYHFDFRYLFFIDKIVEIKFDEEELASYRWVDIEDLNCYGKVAQKIEKLLKK